MSELSLAVEVREQTGKGVARKIRAAGRIPGVVYGLGKQTVSLSLDPAELEKLIKTSHAGLNTLFSLKGDECVEGRTVLIKEIQREPVKGTMVHADLFELDLNARLHVSVPIHIVGTPEGVTYGGMLEHLMREIELDCMPNAIPDALEVDVSALNIGDTIYVSELAVPEDVVPLVPGELPVVSVVIMKVHEIEAEEAEEVEGEVPEGVEGEAAEAAGKEGKDKEEEPRGAEGSKD
jgi:large subunit ribosomal protein L25